VGQTNTGKIFVEFSNGAFAVGTVTAYVAGYDPGTGGGGGSGGSDEPDIDDGGTTPTEEPVADLPVEKAAVDEATATAVVDTTTTLNPEIIAEKIQEAIEKIADATDPNAVPTLNIPVELENSASAEKVKAVEVAIALDTLQAIVDNVDNNSELPEVDLKVTATNSAIGLALGEITLNTEAIRALILGAGDSAEPVKLVITKSETKLAADEILTAEQAKVLEENSKFDADDVFDISLLVGNKSVTNFGSGKLTIALPYRSIPGAKPADFWAYHLSDTGVEAKMTEGRDYSETGKTIFKTSHLSVYAVAYEPEAPTPDPEPEPTPSDGGSGGGCDAGFGVAAGLLLAATYVAARKGGKR
jgi:Synergist-CTERM protein sorting domain-containing protein